MTALGKTYRNGTSRPAYILQGKPTIKFARSKFIAHITYRNRINYLRKDIIRPDDFFKRSQDRIVLK